MKKQIKHCVFFQTERVHIADGSHFCRGHNRERSCSRFFPASSIMLGRGVTTCTAAATAGNVKMRFTPAVKQNITKLLDIKVF